MRARSLATVGLLLLAPGILAGCLGGDDSLPARDYQDGFGFVQIWVNRPLEAEDYPIKQMLAVPRFVAFVAGDNDTKGELGPGYTDMALGWTSSWLRTEPGKDEWPAEAQRDWTKRSTVWYEGQVPAGDYSVVRVEVIAAWMQMANGVEPHVSVQGDRLSVAPADGQTFTVEEGKDLVLVFESKLEESSYGRFIVR